MFDQAAFIAECRAALETPHVLDALTEALRRVLMERAGLLDALPVGPGLRVTVLLLHRELTVARLLSPPGFSFPPHNHEMLSVVGVYSGIEENVYYRRADRGLVEIGRHPVGVGEVVSHDLDVIHGISNGADEPLAALHVYAGDFFGRARSEWSGDPMEERPYDLQRLQRLVSGAGR